MITNPSGDPHMSHPILGTETATFGPMRDDTGRLLERTAR